MLTGILAAIGFSLIGAPYPVLLGAVIAVCTLIPLVGATAICLPISLYCLLIHDYFRGVLILIFGIVVLTIIPQNVLLRRPARKGAYIHPLITILAYTAPIFVVGIIGLVVGPTLYGFPLAVYRTAIYLRQERKEAEADRTLRQNYHSQGLGCSKPAHKRLCIPPRLPVLKIVIRTALVSSRKIGPITRG